MRQKLMFEEKWEKTVSKKDRRLIESAFEKTSDQAMSQPTCHWLFSAINYRGELLVTVLIHNPLFLSIDFSHQPIVYSEKKKLVARNDFHLPRLSVPGKTSMPWTFIFPCTTLLTEPKYTDGQLLLEEESKS